jgi:hypothetical protein
LPLAPAVVPDTLTVIAFQLAEHEPAGTVFVAVGVDVGAAGVRVGVKVRVGVTVAVFVKVGVTVGVFVAVFVTVGVLVGAAIV